MIADQFVSEIQKLSPSMPETFWDHRQFELIERVRRDDLADFLTWPTITSTMFVGDTPTIRAELEALQASSDWPRWERAIQEDAIGQPARLSGHAWTSGNLIHQAYHLHRWENLTGKRIDQLQSIIEIGGGYGAMAKVVRRLGFAGRYLICDIPAFALLQNYYLACFDIQVEHLINIDAEQSADLIIALWSLDEMPRARALDWLTHCTAEEYLIATNGVFNIAAAVSKSARIIKAIDLIG